MTAFCNVVTIVVMHAARVPGKQGEKLLAGCKDLNRLREIIYATKERYFPQDDLHPVPGEGKAPCPKIMGIFINPTARNISSHNAWSGPRYPFVGIKSLWRVFHKAGILDPVTMGIIESSRHWTTDTATAVLDALVKTGIYLTNIVKRSYRGPQLPDKGMVEMFLPILLKEIEIVQPLCIVTFGGFPFFHLTGHRLKLDEYYRSVDKTGLLKCFTLSVNTRSYRVIPCYFPAGRGNPLRAAEILRRLWNELKAEH